jgi:hypothetical protein
MFQKSTLKEFSTTGRKTRKRKNQSSLRRSNFVESHAMQSESEPTHKNTIKKFHQFHENRQVVCRCHHVFDDSRKMQKQNQDHH